MKKPRHRLRLPSATSVVARSYPDNVIGVENELPWRLSTDLKYFKKITSGHAIIMGRKTLESIGKPLPNRKNIVLSRTPIDIVGVVWAPNIETALLIADAYCICSSQKNFYVIGGEQIYKLFEKYINRVYLTEVFCGNMNGDAKFEVEFDKPEWKVLAEQEYPKTEKDEYPFRISHIKRLKPFHRYEFAEELIARLGIKPTKIEEYRDAQGDVDRADGTDTQFQMFPEVAE